MSKIDKKVGEWANTVMEWVLNNLVISSTLFISFIIALRIFFPGLWYEHE